MADLYSVIAGLQPTQQDIIEAELLAKQILEAQYPNLDLREGTAIRDLTLRPSAFILALCKKGMDTYFSQNTLINVDNTTPKDVVDSIMSNWFLPRRTGSLAIISARLYFARQKNISIPVDSSFSTDGSILFYPTEALVIQASSLRYDSFSNEYYTDVELQAAAQGTDYNINQGSLLYFSSFDPYFLHGEINYLLSESIPEETNTEFVSRATTAISTRNLINYPSIISNLQDNFNYLTRIYPVGGQDADMYRDQIKAIFEPEVPRLATSTLYSSGTVTVTLPLHGFFTGQTVHVTGAVPIGYNVDAAITVVDLNTFTYALGSNPGTCTIQPYIQSYTNPVYIHNAGDVDVYCGDSVTTSLVQISLDANGIGTVPGPNYAISRSSTTGGVLADTVPFDRTIVPSVTTFDSSGGYINVTSVGHGLSTGNIVQVSGLTQSRSISAINCNFGLVTATATAHGLTTGDTVVISGVSPTNYCGTFTVTVIDTNTFTYTITANVLIAGSGTSMTMTNGLISGNLAVQYVSSSQFKIVVPNLWAGASPTGTISIRFATPYTVTNPNLTQRTATSITSSGNIATVTLPAHCIMKNRWVNISGATPSGYNGWWKVLNVPDGGNQFEFTLPSGPLSTASGTIMVTYTAPDEDVGFSERQSLVVNFGSTYANETASFQLSQFNNVSNVQAYLDSPELRVVCGDYLARGFNLYVLDFNLVSYETAVPSTAEVAISIQSYLSGLSAGAILVVSDIVKTLGNSSITGIQTPLGVSYTYYHRDLMPAQYGTITDYLDPTDPTVVFVLGNVTTSGATI